MSIHDYSQVCAGTRSRSRIDDAITDGGICSACVLRSISQIRQLTWSKSLTISSLFTPSRRDDDERWTAFVRQIVQNERWVLQLVLIKRFLIQIETVPSF